VQKHYLPPSGYSYSLIFFYGNRLLEVTVGIKEGNGFAKDEKSLRKSAIEK